MELLIVTRSTNVFYISKNIIIEEVRYFKKLALIAIEDNYFVSNFSINHFFN
jgi:hypothetical protein